MTKAQILNDMKLVKKKFIDNAHIFNDDMMEYIEDAIEALDRLMPVLQDAADKTP